MEFGETTGMQDAPYLKLYQILDEMYGTQLDIKTD